METKGFFNLKLAFSASFEYQCYGSAAILNVLILPVRGPSLYVRIYSALLSMFYERDSLSKRTLILFFSPSQKTIMKSFLLHSKIKIKGFP